MLLLRTLAQLKFLFSFFKFHFDFGVASTSIYFFESEYGLRYIVRDCNCSRGSFAISLTLFALYFVDFVYAQMLWDIGKYKEIYRNIRI